MTVNEPKYIRPLGMHIPIQMEGWTITLPPALHCDKNCKQCKYRLYGLLGKCMCAMIALCGSAIPDKGVCIQSETEAWIQSEQGLIPPNPGGPTEGWKFHWATGRKCWIRHYY